MTGRQRVAGGAPWEAEVGYSRAIRVGGRVLVAGTTAVDAAGDPLAAGAYEQTLAAFEIALRAVEAAGGRREGVVRTRMYVVDITANAEAVGRAHHEAVGAAQPVATMVGVAALIDPRLLVEVELEAVI
ncbi:MAG TPA: RidA family protein [Bacteroidetes bacterium]|nr:RidA family protein [Bacteroidota bacterium]HIL58761.1 RidA family protein [Rhodothermales bacterium]